MSITPGWIPENKNIKNARIEGKKLSLVIVDIENYYLDNGQEYTIYPRTPQGWWDLCEDLKHFEV